jgi:hypothetical protein
VAGIIYGIRYYRRKPIEATSSPHDANLRTYRSYATAHESYRFWPDYLFECFNFSEFTTLGIITAIIYLLGMVIAWPFGFIVDYVATPAIYLGLAGIILVIAACHWGSLRVHPDCEQLRPVFTVDDATYHRVLDKWFTIFRSIKAAALFSLLFFIFGFSALILAYTTSTSARQRFDLEPLRPNMVGSAWYSHRFEDVGFSIILIFLILISITLGTGCWLLVANMLFLLNLRVLPVIPVPTIVRTRLRRMADLYVGTSLTWSAGVAMFGILFYKEYNILSGAFLAILFIIGILMFTLPQAICRFHIIRSHELLCAMALAELYKGLGMSLQERDQTLATDERLADNLSDLYAMTDRPKTLVYDVQNVVLWLGSEILALAAILPHSLLLQVLHFLRI